MELNACLSKHTEPFKLLELHALLASSWNWLQAFRKILVASGNPNLG